MSGRRPTGVVEKPGDAGPTGWPAAGQATPARDPGPLATGAGRAPGPRAPRRALQDLLVPTTVIGAAVLLGNVLGGRAGSLLHDRMLPWILGRSLGVAAYLALTALVLAGLWLRHPWRTRFRTPHPEAILRAHATLAACTITLLAGHLTAIALDRYAGVGWAGALVPWHAAYRPTAVALGTLGLYAFLLVGATAALAGTLGRRMWFPVHAVSSVVFGLTVMHGVLAGSDSHTLRWLYVATGALVAGAQLTRRTARNPSSNVELDPE